LRAIQGRVSNNKETRESKHLYSSQTVQAGYEEEEKKEAEMGESEKRVKGCREVGQ
jgi:hypothetical protein